MLPLCFSLNVRSLINFADGFNPNKNGAVDLKGGVLTDSNLKIVLELVSWKSIIDVTGDNKVLKKITKAGEGVDRPNEGSLVKGDL